MKEPAALVLFGVIILLVAILSAIPMTRDWLRNERRAHPMRNLVREGALYGILFALGQTGLFGREVLILALPLGVALAIGWILAWRRRARTSLAE